MSDTGSMVERVARAICREECEYPGITYSVWDASLSDVDRKKYIALARAAILAMESLTPYDAEDAAAECGCAPIEFVDGWRAMIRKAAEG